MSIRVLFSLLLICTGSAGIAQTQAELERKRASIISSIRDAQAQLEETKKDKNATMAQLRALQGKLDARKRLIGAINEEIQNINGNIQHSTLEVSRLQNNLEGFKARYAASVRYAYRYRSSYGQLAFLFSASDYNDALRRLKYMRRYRDYRRAQVDEIRQTQGYISQKIDVLAVEKSRKDQLLSAEEQQRLALQAETRETNGVVSQLKGREKELLVSIQKNQKATKQVDQAVQRLIARQMEEDRKRAIEEQRRREAEAARVAAANKAAQDAAASNGTSFGSGSSKVTLNRGSDSRTPANGPVNGPLPANPSSPRPAAGATVPAAGTIAAVTRTRARPAATPRDLILTPEAQALSASFAANRGRLPWPVERGVITGKFGPYQHPVAKVTMENLGIIIQTSPGAAVRTVFEGSVSSIISVGGRGSVVLVTHGEYYTVYANLASVNVKRGDLVRTKQSIGTVTLDDEGLPTLDFQVWKGRGKLNPESWIAN